MHSCNLLVLGMSYVFIENSAHDTLTQKSNTKKMLFNMIWNLFQSNEINIEIEIF